MAYAEPDLPALQAALHDAFPDQWETLVATVDDRYEPEDEPRESHYAWFGSLVEAVLAPAIDAGDRETCDRVMAFALPLHGTSVGDAVQHRVLRYACRPDVAPRLRPLLASDQASRLAQLCEVTGNGQ